MNKVLIIGVDGFLGSEVARFFSAKGCEVLGIGSPRTQATDEQSFQRKVLPLESDELRSLIRQQNPDLCVYAAGGADVRNSMSFPHTDFLRALPSWMNLLEGIRVGAPSCKCLFFSSAAVYGNPVSLPISEGARTAPLSSYGYHKLMCELALQEYVKLHGLRGASLRIFSAYGEGLRRQVVWDLSGKISRERSLSLCGTGQESRDFIAASDLASATYQIAISAPLQGECYNIASGEEIAIGQIARWVSEEYGTKAEPIFDGVVPPGVPSNWRADVTSLLALGWKPSINAEDGLRRFARWCLKEQRNT